MEILNELNRRALPTEGEIIDKVCNELSLDAAAVMLEVAGDMVGAGWDENGGIARASRILQRRLAVQGSRVQDASLALAVQSDPIEPLNSASSRDLNFEQHAGAKRS